MKIVEQKVEILHVLDREKILKLIEVAGRTAYKSEKRITENSASKFVQKIVKLKHLSVLEHISVSFRIITNRAIGNEIVRHRIASYTQESTRYVKYTGELEFIEPMLIREDYIVWAELMEEIEKTYHNLIKNKVKPEIARGVLPLDLKTEIVVTMNLRSWLHFIDLRTDTTAHYQIRAVANEIKEIFNTTIPEIFF